MDNSKIELIEQPVNNINELVMLSDFSPIPIAVDEIINVTAGLKGWIDGFQCWEEVKKEIENYGGGEQ